MKTEFVYAIFVHNLLVYIGRTNNLAQRRWQHLYNIKKGRASQRFLECFKGCNPKDIEFIVAYTGTHRQVCKREKEMILDLKPKGNTEFLDPVHQKIKEYYKRLRQSISEPSEVQYEPPCQDNMVETRDDA